MLAVRLRYGALMIQRAVFCAFAAFLLAFGPALAGDVPLKTQRLVQQHFAPQLVLPATALWRFDVIKPYQGGGDIVCGKVNFQNSTRRYIGYLGFYAVVRNGTVGISGIEAENTMEDPTGAFKFAYQNFCGLHS